MLALALLGSLTSAAHAQGWYAGRWDSTIYNRSERPKTVGVRVEIVDAETGLSLPNVSVMLKGWYVEEQIGPFHWPVVEPKEPQQREFEMVARTGPDGVVVFALGWRKRYPWDLGRPEPKVNERGVVTYRDVHSSWTRPVDDVEKVRQIEIRHPQYAYTEIPFTF
jgi:hypothetical protein